MLTYIGQTTKVQGLGGTSQGGGGIFVDLKAMSDIVSDTDATRRYQLNGWALDSVVEPLLWGSVGTTGRPSGPTCPSTRTPRDLLGRPAARPPVVHG